MSEDWRFAYNIPPDGLVIDAGCFRGDFSRGAAERWGCDVVAFEASRSILMTFHVEHPPVGFKLLPFGLGASDGERVIGVAGDGTSCHLLEGRPTEIAEIVDVAEVFRAGPDSILERAGCRPRPEGFEVDLLKLNVEGMEYEILQRLIETDLIKRVRHLQVQFHLWGAGDVGPEGMRGALRYALSLTHTESWNMGAFIWEGWERRV